MKGETKGESTPVWFHHTAEPMRTMQATGAVRKGIDASAMVVIVCISLPTMQTMQTMIFALL
jgi:hypothetical protein